MEIAPGLDGLVHLSEMSHVKRVMRAEEIVTKGDTVTVNIKDIDPVKKRISLSIKDVHQDPWAGAAERYRPGTAVQGTLEKREKFGLFINLEPGVTGLLPGSMISGSADPSVYERLKPGDGVSLVVDSVDETARRITLASPDAKESDNWKSFSTGSSPGDGLGSMGSLLMEALNKKKDK